VVVVHGHAFEFGQIRPEDMRRRTADNAARIIGDDKLAEVRVKLIERAQNHLAAFGMRLDERMKCRNVISLGWSSIHNEEPRRPGRSSEWRAPNDRTRPHTRSKGGLA